MQLTVKQFVLAGILLPFFILLTLALVREPINRKLSAEGHTIDQLYSVSVGKKGLALAAKFDSSYQIVYESAPTILSRCDVVVTTGLEQYTDPEIKLGYISHIRPSTKNRYLEIIISSENPCARS